MHCHCWFHVLLVESGHLLAVDFGLLSHVELQLVDVSVLVSDHVVVLRVTRESLHQRDHVRSKLSQQLLQRVIKQQLRMLVEVPARIQARVVNQLLDRKNLDELVQQWAQHFVFEIVFLDVLNAHQDHHVLDVRPYHPLRMSREQVMVLSLSIGFTGLH